MLLSEPLCLRLGWCVCVCMRVSVCSHKVRQTNICMYSDLIHVYCLVHVYCRQYKSASTVVGTSEERVYRPSLEGKYSYWALSLVALLT